MLKCSFHRNVNREEERNVDYISTTPTCYHDDINELTFSSQPPVHDNTKKKSNRS